MSAARKRAAPRPTPSAPSAARSDAAVALAIALLVAAVYAPVVGHEFVDLDDPVYFIENPNLDGRLGLDDAIGAFRPYAALWVPVTWFSIAIDNALYGVDPTGPLVTNAVLHAVASLLLFFALRAFALGTAVSAFIAAVFAVHPVHVESVAWATERKDVLMGVGFCGALLAYARYRERPSPGRYAALFGAAAFAMLAKPGAATLPFALLLLDYWPLRRPLADARAAVIEKLPLFALSVLASAMTVASQTGGANTSVKVSLLYRALNAGRSYADYAIDAFWPSGLAVFYPYRADELTGAASIAACAAVVLVSALALWIGAARRHLFVGWFWFVGTLVPMLGLVQMGSQARADRYLYLPLIGLALAVGGEARELAQRRPALRRAIAGAGVVAVAALAVTAYRQVGYWRDSTTLFAHAAAVTRDNLAAQTMLAKAYRQRGDLARAEQALDTALEIDPESGNARADLALVYVDQNRIDEARAELARAREDGADAAKVHWALGLAAERSGDLPGAIASYREALRVDPGRTEVANNLAWILATASDPSLRAPAEALELAQRAARSNAEPSVLDTLAAAYAALGRYGEAASTQSRALAALPPGASPLRADLESRFERYQALAQ
jgi:Tfp pilus assembly protein PilF